MVAGGLPSVGGVSSLAIWPILMNWQLISSSVSPIIQCMGSQIDFQDVLRRFLQTWTGFLLTGTVLSIVVLHLLYNAWKSGSSLVLSSWSANCSISEDSVYHKQLKNWLSKHPVSESLTSFAAPEDDRDEDAAKTGIDFSGDSGSLDVHQLMLKAKPKWNPDLNKIHFWIDDAYFWFKDKKNSRLTPWGKTIADNSIEVYCFTWNRSSEPIKNFLTTIKRDYILETSSHTIVWAPQQTSNSFYPNGWHWIDICERRRRPLDTVILDRAQKATILNDVRSFLSRDGVQWYNAKGLPLRLGYLFYGPPGTGKSSFAFALAGTFGLPIFLLNLSLNSLSDAAVQDLFSWLPFHCIIMLEDIDATKPMQRRDEAKKNAKMSRHAEEEDEEEDDDDETIADRVKNLAKKNTVTLSGVLNAIDGIGASEGRILIMSTNKIEDLDEALIRAGRADRLIKFTNITKEQAQEMFYAAYTGTRWKPHVTVDESTHQVEDYTDEDITRLAKEFSDKIHNEEFSPALLQQYFKDFRAEPRLALSELDKWMEDPRAYCKSVFSKSIEKAPRSGTHSGGNSRLRLLNEASMGEKNSSVVEDLMSLDDLGGYEQPACFDREFEEKLVSLRGPLLNVS